MASLAWPAPFRRRIDAWFASHNPPSRGSIYLHNRRLYILPTRFGYLFAIMVFSLFLAAINYQNSMAFVLTFMLTALGILSLWQTHRNLLGVTIKLETPRAVFCGESTEFIFQISQQNNAQRFAIGLQYAQQTPVYASLKPESEAAAKLKIPTTNRGQFKPEQITIFTRYPTGLFHAWGLLRFDIPILIYPAPLANTKLRQTMVEQYQGQSSASTIEGDDFAGLREHREGESLRHISWKAYAQGRGLLTKTFQGHARPSLWIDWYQINEASLETKLRIMTQLVLSAEAADKDYGLKLPGISIEQSSGNAHKHRCLHALAIFRQSDFDQSLGSHATRA
ncbi:MAG: hypothetical protein ACI9LO_002629 [Planctomycetota bacterium]|jgi:uncharacterized protein (DUF58 family)